MKDKFIFEFAIEDDNGDDIGIIKSFNVIATTEDGERIKEQIDTGDHDGFEKIREQLEEDYGVHDVGFSPSDEFYGFCTYEVEPDKIDELMEKWKEFFVNEGLTVDETKTEVIRDED